MNMPGHAPIPLAEQELPIRGPTLSQDSQRLHPQRHLRLTGLAAKTEVRGHSRIGQLTGDMAMDLPRPK